MRTRRAIALAVVTATITAALATSAGAATQGAGSKPAASHASSSSPTTGPQLLARASLSADYLAPGPASGAQATPANGRTGPFAGQVIPGFSAAVDNHDGSYLAMADNGFGAKSNSADFLLRVYRVTPSWTTAQGGAGTIKVGTFIQLRDPRHKIDFPLSRADRVLTGADFDIESLVRQPDGTLWIGEEFGPFLLHFDAKGVLLQAPVPFVDGKSPGNPYLAAGEKTRVASSRGFEAMAASSNGRWLYPIVEGALTDDPVLRRRWIYQFDTRTNEYTGKRWAYQTDQDANDVGDAQLVGKDKLWVIERDDFEGPASVTKRVYEIDLSQRDADGFVPKTLVLDALRIANPKKIGSGTGYGTGSTFSFPVQSFETIVPLGGGKLLLANDNNYPGNSARNPGTPDDTEMAIVDLHKEKLLAAGDATVIGHRGASGYRPEHTLASYETAIAMCADYIEPDLVSTKDHVLVARHENEIGGTTNVADHPEFAARKTTKTIDGHAVTGWFTEDFTLAELKTLRAKERLPQVRPANTAFDGKFQIPTFDEVLDLARHSRTCSGKPVGVYPETKHPTYFDSIGLSLEEPLLAQLKVNGFTGKNAPVLIQSFETSNLKELATKTKLPLVQLVDCSGAPYDLVAAGDTRTYADLVTKKGLRDIATYADGLGACKDLLIPRDSLGNLLSPTKVIRNAHDAGLIVHAWTFRRENQFLPAQFRLSSDPNGIGDLEGEIRTFVAAGLDGVFTDNADIGVAATH